MAVNAGAKPRVRVKAGREVVGAGQNQAMAPVNAVADFGGMPTVQQINPHQQVLPAAPRAMAPAHRAASRTGSQGSVWRVSGAGPNRIAIGAARELMKRARDMERNDPTIGHGVDTLVDFIVGDHGIRKKLPQGAAYDRLRGLWADWCHVCDPMGVQDFVGLQRMVARTVITAGEMFIRFRPRRVEDGLPVPLQLQMLEPEFCPLECHTEQRLVNGVLFDALDRVVGYKLFRTHPEDRVSIAQLGDNALADTVPANRVAHIYRQTRAGQVRGVSKLAPALISAALTADYKEAETVRKWCAALLTGTIEVPTAGDSRMVMPGSQEPAPKTGYAPEEVYWNPEPGTWLELPPGFQAKFNNPQDVGANYGLFLSWQYREVAQVLDLPYHFLTTDYTGTSERSLLVEDIRFRRALGGWRGLLAHQMLTPCWAEFVNTAVISGEWDPSDEEYRTALKPGGWIMPPVEHIRPGDMIRARQELIRNGAGTLTEWAEERGRALPDILAEREAEIKLLEQHGIRTDTNPAETNKSGAAQNVDPDPPAEDDPETDNSEEMGDGPEDETAA